MVSIAQALMELSSVSMSTEEWSYPVLVLLKDKKFYEPMCYDVEKGEFVDSVMDQFKISDVKNAVHIDILPPGTLVRVWNGSDVEYLGTTIETFKMFETPAKLYVQSCLFRAKHCVPTDSVFFSEEVMEFLLHTKNAVVWDPHNAKRVPKERFLHYCAVCMMHKHSTVTCRTCRNDLCARCFLSLQKNSCCFKHCPKNKCPYCRKFY